MAEWKNSREVRLHSTSFRSSNVQMLNWFAHERMACNLKGTHENKKEMVVMCNIMFIIPFIGEKKSVVDKKNIYEL